MNHGNKKFQKGLGYILSHEATSNNNRRNQSYADGHDGEAIYYVGWSSGDDPIQLALWAYIKSYQGEAENFFNESLDIRQDKIVINNSNKTIKEKPNYWKYNDYGKKYPITYKENSLAYTIFKNAQSERENINTKYDFEIILYKNGDSQKFIHVITAKKEEPAIANLTINKKDSLTGKNITEATFNLEISNIAGIKGETVPDSGIIKLYNRSVNENGQLVLQDLRAKDPNKDITITITEIKAPGGYKISNGTTTIILEKNGSDYKIKSGNASIANNAVTININNQPLINLSGNVWKDAQIGEKEVSGPNGIKDGTEKGIKDIIVELYDIKNNKVTTTSTDANGNYKFENIDKTKEGYKIIFKYNGIKYNATTTEQGVSKGTEIDRQAFNDDFKTISNGQSNAVQGLTYTYSDEKSVLNATNAGHTTGTTDAKFQIKAETPVYYDSRFDANLGLVERYFDLAVGTDVKSATLKINDKETTYSYAQIMNGALEDLDLDKILQNNSSTSDVKYNLYLYTSDYNYRISDYKTGDEAIKNTVNPDDNKVNNYENLKKLEAYVTYSVILKNQTTYDATVEQFVYYYDAAYIPQFEVNDVIDGYKVVSIENNKITFESVNAEENILKEANSYRKEIDLTFKVSPDANGNITTKTATNVAEITKYSTAEGGLIDKDSAPDNADVTFENGTPKVGRYEDDTDEAKGINISVKEDKIRTITGTVFEDLNKDGVSNDNKPVNDVIVQLIEIKKISGKYYEYIWQETRSGSNQVKTTARNGYAGETYTNSVAEGSGMYEFKHYIPGNYIIRFIYGDGTAYDITTDEYKNSAAYNGQDYKSTIDANYNETWYNTAGYEAGQSVARDNEARRLDVMAYSSTIDQTIGQSLENRTKEDLKNTWMCAETSRINVPVDADNKATDANSTIASYDYTKNNKKVEFGNINFGLALRPETKLILEKHITGLKITPNGTGVQPIIDATADIEQIINGTTVDTKGVTSGLATIKSERNERGFWKVETDIEELAQGAQLEVEYTYVIRNESDEDYLSSDLVEAYKSKDIKEYSETLGEIKKAVKDTMRSGIYSYSDNNQIGNYLGQYYYNGNSEGCAEVLSRVEKLEEAVNNQLKYDETISGEDFKKANTEAVPKNTYDTDGNLVDNVTNGTKNIETVVETTSASDFLAKSKLDYSKTLKLTTVLTSFNNGEGYYPSYIAEITKYSNAAGRRNMEAEPANLSYVHSEDTRKTIETDNEVDEFWGEQIIISKPTGFNKQLAIQITIVTISSIAVIGVGIVLIKKFVLKK